MARGFFDVQSPFFRPLWRRVLVTALTLAWAGVEVARGATFWAMLFGGAGIYLAWAFFIDFKPEDEE